MGVILDRENELVEKLIPEEDRAIVRSEARVITNVSGGRYCDALGAERKRYLRDPEQYREDRKITEQWLSDQRVSSRF